MSDFCERRSEAAFAELVRRHIDHVYSAALRMVCDTHLAEDVTQGVFVALAKNAQNLTDRPVLSGWLHRTAQNLAANAVRTEVRRRARESEAAAMNELLATESDATWEHIAPLLDAALDELSEPDRDALMLRYFERKPAGEMAQILGISDEAAQKRVSRAVERVREIFAKRGVAAGAGGLMVIISANAVQAAPVGLALTVSTAAVVSAAVHTSTAIIATKAITMTTLQKVLAACTIAAVTGTGVYEARQESNLRNEVRTLQSQQAPLVAQVQQLTAAQDEATNSVARLLAENATLQSNADELLRLRGEVGQLRRATNELAGLRAQNALLTTQAQKAAAQTAQGRIATTPQSATDAMAALQLSRVHRNECVNTLRRIDGAKQMWGLENKKTAKDVPTWEEIQLYFPADTSVYPPVCPDGGVYQINNLETAPTCSFPGHALN